VATAGRGHVGLVVTCWSHAVYLSMLSCLIQLTRLHPGLINFGNIKMLVKILKPKFMEPEVGVVISISISNCILEYKMLTVLWIGFCLTGPISVCLDSFLYGVLLCVVCMRRFVTR